jgi:hypothetical protein
VLARRRPRRRPSAALGGPFIKRVEVGGVRDRRNARLVPVEEGARGELWGCAASEAPCPRRVPYGARCVRSDGQSTPAKNGCALISSVDVWPRRPSRSQSNARTCRRGVLGRQAWGAICGALASAAFES